MSRCARLTVPAVVGFSLLLALIQPPLAAQTLPQDQGAVGTWQALTRLGTTASVLHTTAHPDDEDGGLLAWLSRGRGVQVALLTLNRGEGGDNALGPELFDALGLVRTEELRVAGRYYGLDRQYFTPVVDYGFSKRLDEAFDKWGRPELLRDVVRVIRAERPLVVISRFRGDAQDGHGNHQAAGVISREAFEAAGDPARFPELDAEGLRPWTPRKLYVAAGRGVDAGSDDVLVVDTGVYSPWLGDSYQNFARIGLSYQRSQNAGALRRTSGPSFARYQRVEPVRRGHESDPFEGIDITIPGLFSALGRPAPEGFPPLLAALDAEVKAAVAAFRVDDPSVCVPALARGLKLTREAIARCGASEPDAAFLLVQKERQFQDAIRVALGLDFSAHAQPVGLVEPTGPYAAFAPAPLMGPVVPGQKFAVKTALTNRGRPEIHRVVVRLHSEGKWSVEARGGEEAPATSLSTNQTDARTFEVRVPEDAPPTRPEFSRATMAENRYSRRASSDLLRPSALPPLSAVARFEVQGVAVEVTTPVRRREANAPYGSDLRTLEVVPRLALFATPRNAILPLEGSKTVFDAGVTLLHNHEGTSKGTLSLTLPHGWTAEPSEQAFSFAHAGETASFRFRVTTSSLKAAAYEVSAVAEADGRAYREGYEVLKHRDLETCYLYRPAVVRVRGVDLKTVPGLRVGYVMGVGDEVPPALEQLGARVERLGEGDLASGDLGRFDAIVTGTRAYAVRDDLRAHNGRLLDYVKAGGNLVVLYNTPEFDPAKFAPFPAKLPGNAEEVSEEDAPVQILDPANPVFHHPNAITQADFNNWVEQRGSKFLASWNDAYTPLLSSHDRGQSPQRGGWVTAHYGKGHYTYCAYAFHRQLPYGVPGAYRLMANLLALGKTDRMAD